MRFLMLDRITELDPGKTIKGIKCWTLSDDVFLDHFPGYPIVPGVLLTESMAQLMGFLIQKSIKNENGNLIEVFPILSVIHKAKFRKAVVPGDQCILHGTLKTLDELRASGYIQVFVDDNLVAESELSFIILGEEHVGKNKFTERHQEYQYVIGLNRKESPL